MRVYEDLNLPGGGSPLAVVEITLAGEGCSPIGGFGPLPAAIGGTLIFKPGYGLAPNGFWESDLLSNELILPSGSVYRIRRRYSDNSVFDSCISVPVTGGPDGFGVSEILVDSPGSVSTPALGLHASLSVDEGVHGLVTHDWAVDGVAGWSRLVMTADGAQQFNLSVSGRRGRFVSTQNNLPNRREVWTREGTDWEDSWIESELAGSDAFVAGDLAQWGHLHGVQPDPNVPGSWRAIAAWTDILFLAPFVLNITAVRFDGTTLTQGSEGTLLNDQDLTQRVLPVVRAQRTSNVTTIYTTVPWLPRVGEVGTLAGMANASFNAAGVTVTARSLARRTISFAQVAANATDADAGGTWTPAVSPPTAIFPYKLKSQLRGNTFMAKQWRVEEEEPDWGDPLHTAEITFTGGGTVPPPQGPGKCALWVGHLDDMHGQAYGTVKMGRIDTL